MGQPIRVPPSRLARLAVALAAVLIGVGASVVAPVAGSANPVGSPGTDVGSGFHAIAPVRLADTRSGEPTVDGAGPRGSIGAGEVIDIVVAGRAGLPASGVDAVAVNLTAVGATDLTYLTAWPAGEVRPTASNLNPLGAEAVTSMALVKVGAAGRISIYNHRGSVHLVVDLSGWFATGGGYVSLNPGRVLDTRVGEPTVVDDGRQTPLGAGETMQLRLAGRAGLPTEGVAAVALAVVALDATAPGFVTIWPAGAARPTASNLNPWGRDPVANLVTVATSADGAVSLFNYDGDVEVVVDVAGWFPVGGGFEPLVPARLVDTRPGEPTIDGAGPRGELGSNGSLTARVAQRAGMPDAVAAVLLNLTVVDASEATYLTVHPGEGPRPTASNLNPAQPRAVTNAVVAQVSAAGTIEVYNLRGAVHVVIDVAGWFPPSQPQPPDEHALLDEAEGVTLPPLADGRPITYGFQGVQGESLSFVIDPLPGPDDKPPCGGTLTVRRPDGSVYAEATGRACAGPFAAIGVDVAVDRTGRWAVSFERRGPPRPTSAGRLTLRRSRTLGRLEVGSPIELRDLPAGAKLRWALPDSDEQLTLSLASPAAAGVGACDVMLRVRATDGSIAAQAGTSDPTRCPPIHPAQLSLTFRAPADGRWIAEADLGPAAGRASLRVVLQRPVVSSAASAPATVAIPLLAAGGSAEWPVLVARPAPLAVTADLVIDGSNCVEIRLLRPDGATAGSLRACGIAGVATARRPFFTVQPDLAGGAALTWIGAWTLAVDQPGAGGSVRGSVRVAEPSAGGPPVGVPPSTIPDPDELGPR